jgi:cardiolipin synthase
VGLYDAGARRDGPVVVHDRVLTVANGITALRLLGLPLFVWLTVSQQAYGKAFLVLVIVGCTDWVDGYVARRFDQVTKLGKLMDPLIDRAMLATAGITLLAVGFIPWWIVALVVVRDVVLLGAGLAVFGKHNPGIPVSNMGKFATACLLIGVPGFLLGHMEWPAARVFLVIAYAYSILGIVTYYIAGYRYVQAAVGVRKAMQEAGETPVTAGVADE